MIHERFDIQRWKSEFPLARLREERRRQLARNPRTHENARRWGMSTDEYIEAGLDWSILSAGPSPSCPEMIAGPLTIALIEQIRAENEAHTRWKGVRVPTDVFVLARGEPERREVTKIGGLPYWPANREWPRASSGEPLTFVAQFNFADSRDIAGDLPGDVLLIFAALGWVSQEELERSGLGWLPTENGRRSVPARSEFHFIWQQLGEGDLVQPGQVPVTDWPILPCYGQIHRTFDWDHPEDEERDEDARDEESEDEYDDIDDDDGEQWLRVLNATKIGGIPSEIQYDPRDYLPGRYLCTLAEVCPDRGYPYPYVNVAEPLGPPPGPGDVALKWGDCGVMHIFIDGQQMYHVIEMS